MLLNFDLEKSDEDIYFSNKEIILSPKQLFNFSTYYVTFKNIENIIKLVNNVNNIIQACIYFSDKNQDYWMILTNEYVFFDICIPHNIDLDNTNVISDLSPYELNIIKELKEYLN
jgi:hypothetical protein